MHIHKMDISRRIAIMALAGYEIVIGIVILTMARSMAITPPAGSCATLIVALLGIAAIATGLANASLAGHIRIITYPKGLQYFNIGIMIEVSWENVKAIEQTRRGLTHVDQLVFNEATIHVSSWRPSWTVGRFKESIALQPFKKAWKHGQLGQDFKQYAPHIAWEEA